MGNTLSQGIEIPVVITGAAVLLSFGVAVVVSVLSAWIPVRRASRLPIKNVVLGVAEETQVSNRFIVGIGIVLFLISEILPKVVTGNMLYIAGGFSLLGLIIATILVIPLITNFLSRCLEHIYVIIFKNEGLLASKNIRNNKNITQNITLLFISISAVIAITVVGNFVNTYITDVFNGAELQGFADVEMSPEFVKHVEGMDGIENLLPVYVYNNQMKCDDITFSRLEATDNLELYNRMLNLNYTNKKMETSSVSSFLKSRSVVLSENCLNRTGCQVGDSITITNGVGSNSYTIVGSFKSRATDVEAIIPSTYAVADFNAVNYNFLAYTAIDPDSVMIQIRDLFGDTQNWSRTVEEFNTDALSTVGAFLQPMHSMTYFILLLAAVGIINNLLINYMQKRRSIAMYKSVGLSNRQNIKMTIIESFTSGMIGAFIAIIISYLEIQTIFIVAGPKISMLPELDFMTFLSAGAMGVLVTLTGSVVPIVKSKKMKLVEDLKMKPITGNIAIEGKNIMKDFKIGETTTRVLKNVSLKVLKGEFVSIMGQSGSGKSTLLYILGGLDTPTEGTVSMNGADISRFNDAKMSQIRRQNIGFVFQFYNLIPNLNVEENIMLPLLLDGKKFKDYRKQLDNILEIVGLSDRRKHTPRELSGGQQQRVAIARALISDPEILFADEPTGNLDSKTGAEIMKLLQSINKNSGQTIIMVTHSPEAAKNSSRIITVKDGMIE